MGKEKVVLGVIVLTAVMTLWGSCGSWALDKMEWCGTDVNIYGFLRNNTGVFTETQPFAQNGSQLATERTWLRTNFDWKVSDQLRFGVVSQLVYEPQYSGEHNAAGNVGGVSSALSKSNGEEYSEYNDWNDVMREAYFEWKPTKDDSVKVGRQIVIWGEALTERVGDVIHPDDGRFSFTFANLEDTRIPSIMVRGTKSFEQIGSSLEYIFNPNLVDQQYRVDRLSQFALPTLGEAGQRFAIDPGEFRFLPAAFVSRLHEVYPTTDDYRYGFRTSTYLEGFQFGFMYFHTQEYSPVLRISDIALIHPDEDLYGFYLNKGLPWPGVLRVEGVWCPDKPMTSLDPTTDGVAYDLNDFFYFHWHPTAPFDLTFEHVGEIVPNKEHVEWAVGPDQIKEADLKFNLLLSTNWLYNEISTSLLVGYWTYGNSGVVIPTIKYTPPWRNGKFSFALQYVNIYGNNNYEGLGIYKHKDLLVLTSQYDW